MLFGFGCYQILSLNMDHFFWRRPMHPEWIKALDQQWRHYPATGGNLYDVLPSIGDFMHPDNPHNIA